MKLSYMTNQGLWPLLLLAPQAALSAEGSARRPANIVFILTDDQDLHMNSLDHMPNVKSLLMDEGTTYNRHYAPTALCCPARVSLLTGLHAHNHHVTDVSNGPNGGWRQILKSGWNSKYLPIWLRRAGYRTYYTGKLFNGMKWELIKEETARGWTKADLLVGALTYQYFHPPFQHIEGDWDNPAKINVSHGEYSTNKVADFAYGYLREAVNHPNPFFVGIAPITPHSQTGHKAGPPRPAPKYKNKLNVTVPRTPNFNPEQRSGVNTMWELPRLSHHSEKILDKHYNMRTEALLSVDDMVKHVVKILDDAGKLDNTYIIYTSDNGFHLGHHRLGPGKKFAIEEDINVPLIIRGPGVPKKRTTELVSAHVDMTPTILKMAGVTDPPIKMDGKPIPHTSAAISAREASREDEHANVEFWTHASFKMNGIKGRKPNAYKSLRLVGRGYDISYTVQCANNAHELYNMKGDGRYQMRNLHPDAPAEGPQIEGGNGKNAFRSGQRRLAGYKIPRLLKRLDALLMVLKSCTGASCRRPWKELHPRGGVENLHDAMKHSHDEYYKSIPWVKYRKCFLNGKISLWAEGKQWQDVSASLANGTAGAGQEKGDEEWDEWRDGPEEDIEGGEETEGDDDAALASTNDLDDGQTAMVMDTDEFAAVKQFEADQWPADDEDDEGESDEAEWKRESDEAWWDDWE